MAFDRCLISFTGLSGGLLFAVAAWVPVKKRGMVLQGFSCHNPCVLGLGFSCMYEREHHRVDPLTDLHIPLCVAV